MAGWHPRGAAPGGGVVRNVPEGRLYLERHHGRTPAGVVARVMQRILTLTTAIRHNRSGQPVLRSLTAYNH
ncbi:hypothetical protein ACFU8Q_33830 [Streptomyces sp. NPDC057543]|uniref:hypothetical protein n=1 Tax=Streptomyces sp. NPDC057543 TaxID=3346163 RepID=UPI0036B2DEDF